METAPQAEIREFDTGYLKCDMARAKTRSFLMLNGKKGPCRIISNQAKVHEDVSTLCRDFNLDVVVSENAPWSALFTPKSEPKSLAIPVQQWSPALEQDQHYHAVFEGIVNEIIQLHEAGLHPVYPSSMGKDSSLMVAAGLEAHRRLLQRHDNVVTKDTIFTLITVDTQIEQVQAAVYSHFSMARIIEYCERHGIAYDCRFVAPEFQHEFINLFAGARKLLSTWLLNSDCAVFLKRYTSERVQKEFSAKYSLDKMVVCLGSYEKESAKRAASMRKHGNTKSAIELIEETEEKVKTFCPLREFDPHLVFEMLNRLGSDPIENVNPRYRIPTFMPSFRLLRALYESGQGGDACELDLGANKNQVGCNGGGFGRQGCHQCLKHPVDKSSNAVNRYQRWAFQRNATKVRDWLATCAHQLQHRTWHPRAYDEITGSVVLQPNVLNSRVLAKMIRYFFQLSHDDLLRAEDFKAKVKEAKRAAALNGGNWRYLVDDAGVLEIINDTTIDDKTRDEFLIMYCDGLQQQLIKLGDERHAIYLSSIHALDGVKLPPYFAIACWHDVFVKGNRIPYPSVDLSSIVVESVGDAMMWPLAKPGARIEDLWKPPHRSWDILDAEEADGIFTDKRYSTQKCKITYDPSKTPAIKIKVDDRVIQPGPHTLKATEALVQQRYDEADTDTLTFTSMLNFRHKTSLGTRLKDSAGDTRKRKIKDKTERKIIRKKNKILRGLTTLRTYSVKDTPSLTLANETDISTWVPSFSYTRLPNVEFNCVNLDDDTPNYTIDRIALADFIFEQADPWETGLGLEACLSAYRESVLGWRRRKHKENGRMSVHRFGGTEPFWALHQSGLLKVNHDTWLRISNIMKRTEVFEDAGLYTLSDDQNEVLGLPNILSMPAHRKMKAACLLSIRRKRNKNRQLTKAKLAHRNSAPLVYLDQTYRGIINELHRYRMSIAGERFIDSQVYCSLDYTGFDEKNWLNEVAITKDWLAEHTPYFQSVNQVLTRFGTTADRNGLNQALHIKDGLTQHLFNLEGEYQAMVRKRCHYWKVILSNITPLLISDREARFVAIRSLLANALDDQLGHWDDRIIAKKLGGKTPSEETVFFRETPAPDDVVQSRLTRANDILDLLANPADKRLVPTTEKVKGEDIAAGLLALYQQAS